MALVYTYFLLFKIKLQRVKRRTPAPAATGNVHHKSWRFFPRHHVFLISTIAGHTNNRGRNGRAAVDIGAAGDIRDLLKQIFIEAGFDRVAIGVFEEFSLSR